MNNSFFTNKEIVRLGLKSFGENVLISKKASFYGAQDISIGDNVRIDDFCILSGKITLKSFIHISAFSALYAKEGIFLDDFSGTSPRTLIFSAVDDFSGDYLVNPMVPPEFTNVQGGRVVLNKYVQLGANTIVMPNTIIHEGAVTGAFSFVNSDLDEWTIYAGIPVKPIKKRKKELLTFAHKFLI